MEKLNKIVEAVVEKAVGRFLPQVQTKAGCVDYFTGCCGASNNQASFTRNCNGHLTYHCVGLCPH